MRLPLVKRHVIRTGKSIFLFVPDQTQIDHNRPNLRTKHPIMGDTVAGHALSFAHSAAMLAARSKEPLFIHGQSGTGKASQPQADAHVPPQVPWLAFPTSRSRS